MTFAAARRLLPWVVVGVLVVAGLVFGLRAWVGLEPASDDVAGASPTVAARASAGAPATPTPSSAASSTSPTPTPTSPTSTPTTGEAGRTAPPAPRTPAATTTRPTGPVVARIRSSLDTQGRPTSIWCPPTVSAAVGTTFRCTVSYASDPSAVVADATVRITSSRGAFTWQSVSRG